MTRQRCKHRYKECEGIPRLFQDMQRKSQNFIELGYYAWKDAHYGRCITCVNILKKGKDYRPKYCAIGGFLIGLSKLNTCDLYKWDGLR